MADDAETVRKLKMLLANHRLRLDDGGDCASSANSFLCGVMIALGVEPGMAQMLCPRAEVPETEAVCDRCGRDIPDGPESICWLCQDVLSE